MHGHSGTPSQCMHHTLPLHNPAWSLSAELVGAKVKIKMVCVCVCQSAVVLVVDTIVPEEVEQSHLSVRTVNTDLQQETEVQYRQNV